MPAHQNERVKDRETRKATMAEVVKLRNGRRLSDAKEGPSDSCKCKVLCMAANLRLLAQGLHCRTPRSILSHLGSGPSLRAAMSDDKPVENAVRQKLTEALKPEHLDVINESYMHNVPKGTESHFKVVIVSSAFENVKRIQKHQLVHKAIQEEIDNCIHALSIVAKTPAEWAANQDIGKSPPCRGGAGL